MTFRPYSRSDRFGHEIRRIVSDIILKEVETKHIGFVTVTDLKVSRDLKLAKVYVSIINRDLEKGEVERYFREQSPHIRKLLGERIKAKSVPELRFFYDETYEEAERLNRLLGQIQKDGSRTQ